MMDYSQYHTQYGQLSMPQNVNPYHQQGMDMMMQAPTARPDIYKFKRF